MESKTVIETVVLERYRPARWIYSGTERSHLWLDYREHYGFTNLKDAQSQVDIFNEYNEGEDPGAFFVVKVTDTRVIEMPS